MIDLTMMASAGLVNLAVSGSPGLLIQELNNDGVGNMPITRNDFTSGAGGRNPTADVFITCAPDDERIDYLAPSGVQLQLGDGSPQDGSRWAMFEPFHYSDHFLIEFRDGTLERWDVGWSEGDNMPFRVQVVGNQILRMDGTPLPPDRSAGPCADSNMPDSTEEESGNDGNDNQNDSEQITEEESDNNGNDNQNDSEQITEEESDNNGNDNQNLSSSGGGGSDIGLAVGGVAVVGIAVYLLSGGTAADVSFAPDYGLHYTEDGGTEYFYGAKWEYEKANWRADWTAMRARKSESWRYASGVEWTAGVWRAAFGGENTGDKTAMDLSLAAERRAGGWMLKSAANANARFDEFGGEFAHYFSAAASRRVSEWEISVSAAARDLDDNPALRADMIFTREF